MDLFGFNDSDLSDYMDTDDFEIYNYGSEHILDNSEDSQSTFISFNSGISRSFPEDSSQDSTSTTHDTQSPSVVIVNSGTGGILWRNRSDDDDESRMSSSSHGSISSHTATTDSATSGPVDRNSPSQDRRYFLRRRRRRRTPATPRAESHSQDMSVVSVSSGSDLEEIVDSEDESARVQSSPDLVSQASPALRIAPRSPDMRDVRVQLDVDMPLRPANNVQLPDPGSESPEVTALTTLSAFSSSQVRTPGKRKASSPVTKKARLDPAEDSEDGGVDVACNICYDDYTAVGPHRPACLKCGHIFGFSCLDRWLKVSCSGGNRRCPTCNKKCHIKDIRLLYCCNLRAVDNSRLHQLSTDLEQEKIQNSKFKVEVTSHKIKIESLEKELTRYKGLEKQGLLSLNATIADVIAKVPVFYVSIPLSRNNAGTMGMARSLVYDDNKKLLLATHQNDTPIFSGFGYSILNLHNLSGAPAPAHKFFLMSQKTIRDAVFHPLDSDLLLIASLDKTARLIDVRSGSRVHTFQTDFPLWSCAWDVTNPNLFLVGGVNGQLARFDKRQTSWQRPIATGGTNVGVVAIIGIRAGPGRGLPRGGFLVCKLNAVLALESTGSEDAMEDSLELLDASGPFMSMTYLTTKNQVLLSSRPAAACPHIRHRVFTLDQSPQGKPQLSLIQTIMGGTLAPSLSRSYIWPEQVQGHSLVYAFDATSKSLCGWSVSDASKKVSLPCQDPILDICRVETPTGMMLAALSDSAVHLYKHP